jgi:hypothetical protein
VIGFLSPWVLAGLPLAALPLVLHLIQRRDPPTVEFPAVRYLVQVTQEHQRRLKLRHWLLLLVRTIMIVAVILAAAGPSAPLRQATSHSPSALVLVLDDSPSSGVVVSGTARLTDLRAAGQRILAQATPSDALWLLTSAGVARRGSREVLGRALDSVQPSARRMDLGQALTLAGEVLRSDARPGGIVLLSDLQATALGPAQVGVPLLIARPAEPPPPNQGIVAVEPGPQPWTPEGGAVTVRVDGDSGSPAPVSVSLADRPARQALVPAGGAGSFGLGPAVPGWWTVRAAKAPDELRADDDRLALVRVAPVAQVSWSPAERYLNAACEVLLASGRIRRGSEITLGALGAGSSIVAPPEDPAHLGALNRALERRGIGWRFGGPVATPAVSDSGPLLGRVGIARRYALQPTRASATAGVVVTASGAPWLVRDGNVVLIGSRLDPAWTALPLLAGFMPFMDALVNRLARGQVATLAGAPGDPVLLPDLVTEVAQGDRRWRVEGGAAFRPPAPGGYYLLAGRDTVGALAVSLDPRESLLTPAAEGAVTGLWSGARLVSLADAAGAAFAGAGRASLQGPLLWLALVLGLVEVGLASGVRRSS